MFFERCRCTLHVPPTKRILLINVRFVIFNKRNFNCNAHLIIIKRCINSFKTLAYCVYLFSCPFGFIVIRKLCTYFYLQNTNYFLTPLFFSPCSLRWYVYLKPFVGIFISAFSAIIHFQSSDTFVPTTHIKRTPSHRLTISL